MKNLNIEVLNNKISLSQEFSGIVTKWRGQRPKFKITVENEENQSIVFSFYGSVDMFENGVQELSEDDLLDSFYCFVSDSIYSESGLIEFMEEFGYNDEEEAKEILDKMECSKIKFDKLFEDDIYIFFDDLREKFDL